ncbi:hypothetical protein CORC01_02428 [Colletotrichum orchidophilum]|uniref:Uncharacterized protein n=1 Tax=Colletotrichum orchidophilum TaxID=1209926 RepID=A0A1G4BLH0_9PEZI|nr:uncharacterized protein CORC01_02428 [Colletotrichum orchidophilum]OHF02148.1 hypothetical protein CORC01_02428 [Colletotrichum orchidophilum]
MDWNGGYLPILSFVSFCLLTQNTSIFSRYALTFWSVIILCFSKEISYHILPLALRFRMWLDAARQKRYRVR